VVVCFDDGRIAGANVAELIGLVPSATLRVLVAELSLADRAHGHALRIHRPTVVGALSEVILHGSHELVHLLVVHRGRACLLDLHYVDAMGVLMQILPFDELISLLNLR